MSHSSNRNERAKQAINEAIELFHRRWALRVIWELRTGPMTFRALQGACSEVSPSVLNQRLGELREAQLVDRVQGEGYRLSIHGQKLLKAMGPMVTWALEWYSSCQLKHDGRAQRESGRPPER
ncbi:MAG TPA: helix-turn-helix domain-containing protein [Steroidobacteraceae bacterium]